MTDSLIHRGPDEQGTYIKNNIGLVVRRLKIIDLKTGQQPISDPSNQFTIGYNGEIYNYKEIKRQLLNQGYRFKSQSDTEVILFSYIHWGLRFVDYLNGMFTVAIWDNQKQQLVIARDRIGIKPLFYYQDDEKFVFASEIKAILHHPSVGRNIESDSLYYHLLLNYIPENKTLFSNIYSLPPGYLVIIKNNTVEFKQYWKITPTEPVKSKSLSLYQDEFLNLFQDSVKIRLQSDVPLGVFLSGGLDSSSVAAMAASVNPSPIQTFSVGFEEKSFDETSYSNLVAQHLKTVHHHISVKPNIQDVLPLIIRHMEEPTADSSAVPVYYLCQYTRQHVTVALSGDGADEIAAGYETYTADKLARVFRYFPSFINNSLQNLGNLIPTSFEKYSLWMKYNRFFKGLNQDEAMSHFLWRIIWYFDEVSQVIHPDFLNDRKVLEIQSQYSRIFNIPSDRDLLTKSLYADTTYYLPNDMLIKVDRMSMANSLEVRVPFLDYRLVEFFFNLPSKYKLRYLTRKKYLIKKSMAPRLPRQIINRPKAGFNVPISYWFLTDLNDLMKEIVFAWGPAEIPFLSWKIIQDTFKNHLKKREDNGYKLWSILILALWYKEFLKQSNVR
jgi:asparagine synthase (glutamine-hydrolysing)